MILLILLKYMEFLYTNQSFIFYASTTYWNQGTQGSHSMFLWKLCQRPIELTRFLKKKLVGTLDARDRVGTIDFCRFFQIFLEDYLI